VGNGLSRELPFYLGKGDTAFSDRLLGTSLFCTFFANAAVVLGGLACVIAFGDRGAAFTSGILAMTLVIPQLFYQHVMGVTFRSKDSFNNLAVIKLSEAGLSLVTVPLVYYFRYEGLLARAVLIAGVLTWLTYVFRPMRVKPCLDTKALKILFKTGLPIFGLDYMKNSASTLDRLILLQVSGVRDVGLYSLGTTALGALQVLPQSLSAYVYPRMTYKYGQTGDARALWRFGLSFVLLAIGLTALAAVCAWFVLPLAVPLFAAKYVSGVRAAQILLISGVLDCSNVIANALWSIKAWRLIIAYQVSCAVLFVVGPLLGVLLLGRSLEAVAWGVAAGALGRSLLAVGLTYCGTHLKNAATVD